MSFQAHALPRRRVVWHRKIFLASIPSKITAMRRKSRHRVRRRVDRVCERALSILEHAAKTDDFCGWCCRRRGAVRIFRAIVSCKLARRSRSPEVRVDEFLDGLDAVIVFEELDSVIEDGLVHVAGLRATRARALLGFLAVRRGACRDAGENDADDIVERLSWFFDETLAASRGVFRATSSCIKLKNAPMRARAREAAAPNLDIELPARPPVLCAGCPIVVRFTHASKRSRKCAFAVSFFGRYRLLHLGNAKPLGYCGYLFVYGRGHHDGARSRRCRFCGEKARFRGRFDVFAKQHHGRCQCRIQPARHHGVRARQFHHGHDGRAAASWYGQLTLMGSEKSAPLSIECVLGRGVECIEFANPIILMRVSMRSRRRFLSRARLRLSSARRA